MTDVLHLSLTCVSSEASEASRALIGPCSCVAPAAPPFRLPFFFFFFLVLAALAAAVLSSSSSSNAAAAAAALSSAAAKA
jgi:hypothetical protein